MADAAERFWDERARENALYFVDNDLDYQRPDADAFWSRGDEVLDRVFDLVGLELPPGQRILDIGCGVGRTTRALAARAAHVTALDVSREMLAQARELNAGLTNVEWVHGDGRTLRPVPDASVDGCFSWVVFQHIPDQDVIFGYIREIARVLRPGGWAVFQVSTNPAVHAARPPVRARLKAAVGRAPRGQDHPSWRGSAVEVEALREAVETGGLELGVIALPHNQYTTVRAHRPAAGAGG